jgi:glycosyltransferase involved in cell wall biosynthesis
MAMLEAMAHSLPVVVTNVGAIPEVIENGVNGRIYEPGDVEALISCLQELLSDSDKCLTIGQAAREAVIQGFSIEKSVELLKNVYAPLLSGLRNG